MRDNPFELDRTHSDGGVGQGMGIRTKLAVKKTMRSEFIKALAKRIIDKINPKYGPLPDNYQPPATKEEKRYMKYNQYRKII